jgi:hypothetical protein
MSGPGLGCDCGGDEQDPAAPAPAQPRGDRALALAPVPVVLIAPIAVAPARPPAAHESPPSAGPSVQALLCTWLT